MIAWQEFARFLWLPTQYHYFEFMDTRCSATYGSLIISGIAEKVVQVNDFTILIDLVDLKIGESSIY